MQAAKEHSEQLGVDGLMLASNYLSNSNLMRAFTFSWDPI
jgi:tRNA-dihydrouridine synthase